MCVCVFAWVNPNDEKNEIFIFFVCFKMMMMMMIMWIKSITINWRDREKKNRKNGSYTILTFVFCFVDRFQFRFFLELVAENKKILKRKWHRQDTHIQTDKNNHFSSLFVCLCFSVCLFHIKFLYVILSMNKEQWKIEWMNETD